MTVLNKLIVEAITIPTTDTPELVYLSPVDGAGTVISNFTVTNNTNFPRSYKAYIVVSGGNPNNPTVPRTVVQAGKSDVSPEMGAQVIPPGGFLFIENSLGSSLIFTVSAREIS